MGLITRTSFSTGDIPTTAQWNTQFDTAYNCLNSNIDSSNLDTTFNATIPKKSESASIAGAWTFNASASFVGDVSISGTGKQIVVPNQQLGNITATNGSIYLANASAASISAYLPSATTNVGRLIKILKSDATANVITIVPSGAETINGLSVAKIFAQYNFIEFLSNGTNWVITNKDTTKIFTTTWDMDTTADLDVTTVVDSSNIASIFCHVTANNGSARYGTASVSIAAGYLVRLDSFVGANIRINREAGSMFDAAGYNAAPVVITVEYKIS